MPYPLPSSSPCASRPKASRKHSPPAAPMWRLLLRRCKLAAAWPGNTFLENLDSLWGFQKLGAIPGTSWGKNEEKLVVNKLTNRNTIWMRNHDEKMKNGMEIYHFHPCLKLLGFRVPGIYTLQVKPTIKINIHSPGNCGWNKSLLQNDGVFAVFSDHVSHNGWCLFTLKTILIRPQSRQKK